MRLTERTGLGQVGVLEGHTSLTGDLTKEVQFADTRSGIGDVGIPLPTNGLPAAVVDYAELLARGGDNALGLETHMSI